MRTQHSAVRPAPTWPRAVALIAALLICANAQAAQRVDRPEAVIEAASQRLLAMLRETPSAQLANTDRLRDQVLPLLSEYADFTRMSRLVLGKHWRRATPAQRAKFTEQFVLVMVRFYAASLRGILQSAPNHAIAIDVLPAQITPDTKRVLVRSRVEIGQERPLQVTYHLYRTSDAWKIYDMAIEGISIVANYRANFASEIRVSGLDGLIRRLEERNAAVRTAFVFSR